MQDKDTENNTQDQQESDLKSDNRPEEETKDNSKDKSSSKMHLYPPLPAMIVPIHQDEDVISGKSAVAFGTLVECQLFANWFQQRIPLYASNVKVLSNDTSVKSDSNASGTTTSLASLLQASEGSSTEGRVKGTIIRVKISTSLGFDLTEISLNEQYRSPRDSTNGAGGLFSGSNGENVHYYCDLRDFRGSADNSGGGKEKVSPNGGVHVGDIVEFIPVDPYGIAACPVLLKVGERLLSELFYLVVIVLFM